MNWSAIHTNTVYSSVFELCLIKNLLCCKSGVPGIWNWPRATVSTCKPLELLSAFPSWLCASTAFTGIATYLFPLFLMCVLKLGIRLCLSDFKTSKKSMTHGSDEVWLLSTYQKPPHLSLITPAPLSCPCLFCWQTRGWSNACADQ